MLKIARMEIASPDEGLSSGGSNMDLDKFSRSNKSSHQVKQKIFSGPHHSQFKKVLQRPRFDEIEKMELDENGQKKQKELARREFAKHKPSFSKTSNDKITTERHTSVKKFGGVANAVGPLPSSNATTRSKRQKTQNHRSQKDKQFH